MAQRALLDNQSAQALKLAATTQISAASVVSRTLLQTPEIRVVLFSFAEGQELTTHTSRRRAIVQVLEGRCEFFYADKWELLEAGTLLHLPPNHPHAVRASSGPFSMLLTLGAESAETASGATSLSAPASNAARSARAA